MYDKNRKKKYKKKKQYDSISMITIVYNFAYLIMAMAWNTSVRISSVCSRPSKHGTITVQMRSEYNGMLIHTLYYKYTI